MYREHLYARLTHACMYAAERLRYSAKIKSAKTFLLNSHPAKFMYTHYKLYDARKKFIFGTCILNCTYSIIFICMLAILLCSS